LYLKKRRWRKGNSMRTKRFGIGLFALMAGLIGCDGSFNLVNVLSGGAGTLGAERINEVEPNNTFGQAMPATIDISTMLDISGSMASDTDIDVYDLGPVAAGERITVSVTNDPSLELAAALFDEQQRLISFNDDGSWQAYVGPHLGVTLRWDCQHCYLAITGSAESGISAGSYVATLLREQGSVPAARPQVLYLQFAGAKGFSIVGRDPVDIPAFDAAHIDPSFEGQSSEMIDAIVSIVQTQFASYNVDIRCSQQYPTIPNDATVIYFGLYEPNLLGLAENCDEYNADLTQRAIIFTDTFGMFMPLEPTLEQMAMAIANVASHEAGHLLGLEHTQDWTELMDTTSPASSLLTMQTFHLATLYTGVFPIGQQDSPLLLAKSLGTRYVEAASRIDRPWNSANTVGVAESRSGALAEGPSSGWQQGVRAAEVSPGGRDPLLYRQGSVQYEVSKDWFAVHSRRSAAR
jgi:hypothetical protein